MEATVADPDGRGARRPLALAITTVRVLAAASVARIYDRSNGRA